MKPRSMETIVNQQVLRWETARKARQASSRAPCVALSRLPYAGGEELGRRVAEQLDYGFFDQEIIDKIEHDQRIQHQLIESLDEQIRNLIERYVLDSLRREPFTESDYLRHLVRTLTTLGERGMAVILGRGVCFVLPPDRALRVLVAAPAEFRAARLAAAQGLPQERAREALARRDQQRADFLRHHFGLTREDPSSYDLVVNTGTLGVEGAAGLVVEALRGRFPTSARKRASRQR